jgi:hypothetical protein
MSRAPVPVKVLRVRSGRPRGACGDSHSFWNYNWGLLAGSIPSAEMGLSPLAIRFNLINLTSCPKRADRGRI